MLGVVASALIPAESASAAYRETVLGTPGLVSFWRLGETAGTTAADVKGLNQGAFVNGPQLGRPGALPGSTDKSVLLDGVDDVVAVPDSATLDLGNVFTLEAWVKRSGLGGEQVIMGKGGGGYWFWFAYDYLALNKGVQSGPSAIVRSSIPLTDTTKWHHVVATKNGTVTKLYIDGIDRTGPVTDVPLANSTAPLNLGYLFKGGLDELAVYSRALSASEVVAHYRSGVDPPPNTTITSAPPASTVSSTASFTFTSSEASSTFQCRLDGAPFQPCSSPKHYTGLSAGTHAFAVRAIDAAGQADQTPATTQWTLGVCEPAFGQFMPGNWPPACWRPYADHSPFNQVIPPNPKLVSNSAAIVTRLNNPNPALGVPNPQELNAGAAGSDYDGGAPVYFSKSTDPVYTIICEPPPEWNVTPAMCEVHNHKIRIPAVARPAGGAEPADRGMVVIDQAGQWEYDFWRVKLSTLPAGGGLLPIAWGGRTPIGTPDSDGLGLGPNDTGGSAAQVGLIAGVIRAAELEAGTINHALAMFVGCDNGTAVYPARQGALKCADTANAPANGYRFQLNMTDSEINALAVPAWKKTILRAMARYGMYVRDTSAGPWGIYTENGFTYTVFGHADPMVTFARDHQAEGDIRGPWNGIFVFELGDGVPWERLRVVDPCVAQRTCS